MVAVIPTNFLVVVGIVALALAAIRTVHWFRARAMRAFAAKRGFHYIGPFAPPRWWLNPAHFKIAPPLPGWISHFHPSGQRIRQVWNVIEGKKDGVSIFIFDAVIGEYRGGQPCTLIVCKIEPSPFGAVTSADRVVQSNGWTILHGSWFLWFSWMMGTRSINGHLNRLESYDEDCVTRTETAP
jgi:hypothetical protein